MSYTIGLDIGGTKISGCIVNDKNEIFDEKTIPTPHSSRENVLETAIKLIHEIIPEENKKDFKGIGISTGGDVDHITGEILSATDIIPDWKGTQLGYTLRKEFSSPVFVENDGSMAVYAEWKTGKAKGFDHIVGLTIGTGLGGGIICDSRLLHGAKGAIANFSFIEDPFFFNDNTSAKQRNLEYYISGPGLIRIGKILDPQNTFDSPESLIKAYMEKDGFANDVMEIFFKYLKYCLNIIRYTIAPEIVVIGGGVVTGNYDLMGNEFHKFLDDYPFKVVPSNLNNKAGMLGAAVYAREMLLEC